MFAAALVFLALITPDQITRLPPEDNEAAAFLRIPVEGLLGVALLLLLPGRARRVAALIIGAALGLLTVMKIINMGFFAALARPFNPVLDFSLADDAVSFLTDSIGRPGAIVVVVGIVAFAIALPVAMTWAVVRLSGSMMRRRTAVGRTAAALTAAWVTCAVFGAQLVPGIPVAARSAADLAYDTGLQVPTYLQDKRAFAAEASLDAYRDTPGSELLTGLRGKDVIISFVESYGRVAIDDPTIGPPVHAALDAGTKSLAAAGFTARSGFLTSPTAGGGSWLAHATFLSGLKIDNEQRYRSLVASDRQTLTGAFGRAGWRTVGVEPGVSFAWPEGQFYGYDKIYDAHTLGYRGPHFSWATMPDQFTLEAFQRLENSKPHAPMLAEITLLSSHTPWAPLPRLLDWNEIGDGSIYHAIAKQGESPKEVWRDTDRVRTEYRHSIEYTLGSLISFVQTYGDDNLVLIMLGDHQPAPIVAGDNASHDVPVTILSHDPTVFDRIADWGWTPGLRPDSKAPVWPMGDFRDRFLTAFGSPGQPAGQQGKPVAQGKPAAQGQPASQGRHAAGAPAR